MVPTFGDLRGLTELFQVAGLHRCREQIHLPAGVVQVALPLHDPSRRVHERGDGVAQGGVAGGAHVKGPGRVGRHEFHLHPLPRSFGPPVDAALRHHVPQHVVQPPVRDVEVDEPDAGHLRGRHEVGGREVSRDGRGDFGGVALDQRAPHERHVRGEVSEPFLGRASEVELIGRSLRPQLGSGPEGGLTDELTQAFLDHGDGFAATATAAWRRSAGPSPPARRGRTAW